MAKDAISIQLYDSDITDLLYDWETDIRLPRSTPDHLGVFENLQEQELIYAISKKNYRKAYRLLEQLDHTLSPQDAIAASLCALTCTTKLMSALLDHCPPIPEFQFQGVGLTASLLAVAARHDKDQMLDLLLKRGADPNGGPTPLTAKSPLEEAFGSSFSSLKRLLEEPGLKVVLTEEILNVWANLRNDNAPYPHAYSSPLLLWSCQLLLKHLGNTVNLFDRMPVPPELQLGHALRHGNPELAQHICETRPPTEQERAQVLEYFSEYKELDLLSHDALPSLLAAHQETARFLARFLSLYPDLLEHPVMRFAVATLALELPEPDEALQLWVSRMADGPIQLRQLPFQLQRAAIGWLPIVMGVEKTVLHEEFLSRWRDRLGARLTPAIDRNTDMNWESLPPDQLLFLLEQVSFTGEPPADKLSAVALQALRWAPEHLLPGLMEPGQLLSVESPHALLDACQTLPLTRRSLILPHLHKETAYDL